MTHDTKPFFFFVARMNGESASYDFCRARRLYDADRNIQSKSKPSDPFGHWVLGFMQMTQNQIGERLYLTIEFTF